MSSFKYPAFQFFSSGDEYQSWTPFRLHNSQLCTQAFLPQRVNARGIWETSCEWASNYFIAQYSAVELDWFHFFWNAGIRPFSSLVTSLSDFSINSTNNGTTKNFWRLRLIICHKGTLVILVLLPQIVGHTGKYSMDILVGDFKFCLRKIKHNKTNKTQYMTPWLKYYCLEKQCVISMNSKYESKSLCSYLWGFFFWSVCSLTFKGHLTFVIPFAMSPSNLYAGLTARLFLNHGSMVPN